VGGRSSRSSLGRSRPSSILRYFDIAGQNHHDDKNQDLFPRLLATTSAGVHELIARLLDKRKVLDRTRQQLRPSLLGIAEGRTAELEIKKCPDPNAR
jgi:hypothetical protein